MTRTEHPATSLEAALTESLGTEVRALERLREHAGHLRRMRHIRHRDAWLRSGTEHMLELASAFGAASLRVERVRGRMVLERRERLAAPGVPEVRGSAASNGA